MISLVFNERKLVGESEILRSSILTAAFMMLTLTEDLIRNDNIDLKEELLKLCKLAHYLTFTKKSFVFILNEAPISIDILKAFCISRSVKDIRFKSLSLIETGAHFQFSHQIIQEYLSALHIICLSSSNDDKCEFLDAVKLFWEINPHKLLLLSKYTPLIYSSIHTRYLLPMSRNS